MKKLTALLGLLLILGGAERVLGEVAALEMRPAMIEEKVEPGQRYNFSVRVKNLSAIERTLYISAQDITGISQNGVPSFAEEGEKTPFELSAWISLPQSIIVLSPEEMREISFSVRVPSDASPGSHFGGVFFEAKPDQLDTNAAAVSSKVGTVINLLVAGDLVEEVVLREFSSDRFVYDAPPVDFAMVAENKGNTIARPHGAIEITDMFGKKVAAVRVNEAGAAVFPNGEREYTARWEAEGFMIGRYAATLNVVYGEDGRRTVVRETSFWIIPLKPTLIALGSLLLFVLALFAFVRISINRSLRRMGVDRAMALHAARYHGGISRLFLIAIGIISVCLLAALLLLFAA